MWISVRQSELNDESVKMTYYLLSLAYRLDLLSNGPSETENFLPVSKSVQRVDPSDSSDMFFTEQKKENKKKAESRGLMGRCNNPGS